MDDIEDTQETRGFLLRLNKPDRAALQEVARRLQRDRTETLRALIRGTLEVLQEQDAQAQETNKKQPATRAVA